MIICPMWWEKLYDSLERSDRLVGAWPINCWNCHTQSAGTVLVTVETVALPRKTANVEGKFIKLV